VARLATQANLGVAEHLREVRRRLILLEALRGVNDLEHVLLLVDFDESLVENRQLVDRRRKAQNKAVDVGAVLGLRLDKFAEDAPVLKPACHLISADHGVI